MAKTIMALKVHQWLDDWNKTKFAAQDDIDSYRRKPEPYYYLFTISAYELKRLSGIYRRGEEKISTKDVGIQRRHDKKRSKEILRFLQNGFPLSRISEKKIVDPLEKDSLRMPGWIPTVIVANILTTDDRRGPQGIAVNQNDLIHLSPLDPQGSAVEIKLPDGLATEQWKPVVHPIEIIDGQHRLWALEEPGEGEEPWSEEFREEISKIEFPVVAFHGLDRTWQAYLFYTINQLPKRVDSSMVFDLYPLLRDEDWLLKFEGPNIYRETRAQDLIVLLMTVDSSPWYERILRFGGREKGKVTQASFIRSLMATFIKSSQSTNRRIGGFFGAPYRSHVLSVDWSREQQAAFLIMIWRELENSISKVNAEWIDKLLDYGMKKLKTNSPIDHSTYRKEITFGPDTLIPTDQGVRGYLSVINDMVYIANLSKTFKSESWEWERGEIYDTDQSAIVDAVTSLYKMLPNLIELIRGITDTLATFDWRLPTAMLSNDDNYSQQASYKGSSGYKLIRKNILQHLVKYGNPQTKEIANFVVERLGYDDSEQED